MTLQEKNLSNLKKRPANDNENPDDYDTAKKLKTENLKEKLQKQIEYYFSDDNLKTDEFFHKKISAEPDGWLEMKYILSCRKIQALNPAEKDLIAAIGESELETKIDDNDIVWIRRPTPLPPLMPKKIQSQKVKSGFKHGYPAKAEDIHTFGYLLQVTNIPEELTWVRVKQAIREALQKEQKFANDAEILAKITTLEINGATLTVSIVSDLELAEMAFDQLPHKIMKDRQKQQATLKETKAKRPIILGGELFDSVNHFRTCYKELLEVTEPGKSLPVQTINVTKALLEYHPNAAEKAQDIVEIKVDIWKGKNGEEKSDTKCFYLIRSDGTTEDFSVVKCIDGLMKNPPYVSDVKENINLNEKPQSFEKDRDAKDSAVKTN